MLWSVVVVLVVLGASAAWQFLGRTIEQTPSSTAALELPTIASSTPATPPVLNMKAVSVTPVSRPVQTPFTLATGDSIASWDFAGAYTGNPELVTKAQNEITRLSGLLTIATSTAMILNVGIANQYELLGNGARQYEYLGRAIQADATAGLPWHNLGVLMERLGALKTARTAYNEAVFLQPQFKGIQQP